MDGFLGPLCCRRYALALNVSLLIGIGRGRLRRGRNESQGYNGRMTDQEINIAIAKKLGWKDLTIVRSERLRDELLGNREGSPPFGETIPDYCHKIEAAWEIVEFVRPAYAFDFHSSRTEYFANMSGPTWKRLVSGKADTAPMAICLAFLKLEG